MVENDSFQRQSNSEQEFPGPQDAGKVTAVNVQVGDQVQAVEVLCDPGYSGSAESSWTRPAWCQDSGR